MSNSRPTPEAFETRLIQGTRADTYTYTNRREHDVETALSRGLREYLKGLRLDAGKGRFMTLLDAFEEYPDAEERAVYPSALVRSVGQLEYDSSSLVPTEVQRLNSTQTLFEICEATTTFEVEVWCTDREERQALTMMLEDGLNPDPNNYGFTLSLPYYHGALGRYSLQSKRKMDNEGDVQRKYRKVTFSVDARAPLLRVFTLPLLQPQIGVEVE